MKLLYWIDKNKLDWDGLCKNPNAIDLIKEELKLLTVKRTRKQNKHFVSKINWKKLCSNPNPEIIELLNQYIEYLDFNELSANEHAIGILKQHLKKINWYKFSMNPNAGEILNEFLIDDFHHPDNDYTNEYKEIYKTIIYNIRWDLLCEYIKDVSILVYNLDKIDWDRLSSNSNPQAIELLERNKSKINYKWLSGNKNAIHLLVDNLDKVDWYKLSMNPNAIYILEAHKDRIDMWELSRNCNASHLLAEHIPKIILDGNKNWINWNTLSLYTTDINLLYQYIDHLDNWNFVSKNIHAINFLKDNYSKISWPGFSENPSIFTDKEDSTSILDKCTIM